jgi:hypothetical protein
MQTHEASPGGNSAVDFCWALDYVLMPGVWAQTKINSSDQQAWRAGFREGVKFAMIDGGQCKDPDLWQRRSEPVNQRRLEIWQQIGLDVDHGAWAILGARQGFYQALFTAWPTEQVRDFDYLDDLWQQRPQDPHQQIQDLGEQLMDSLSLEITRSPLPSWASRWFKKIYPQNIRQQPKRIRP